MAHYHNPSYNDTILPSIITSRIQVPSVSLSGSPSCGVRISSFTGGGSSRGQRRLSTQRVVCTNNRLESSVSQFRRDIVIFCRCVGVVYLDELVVCTVGSSE